MALFICTIPQPKILFMEILRKRMRHAVSDATTKVRAQIPRGEVMYTV